MSSRKSSSHTSIPMFDTTRQLSTTSTTFLQYLLSRKSIIFRLFSSLFPYPTISNDTSGPVLSVFLLTVLIYTQNSVYSVPWPLLLPSLYVLILSSLVALLLIGARITLTPIKFRDLLYVSGYGCFGHTLTLLISRFRDSLFIPALFILTGLSSVKIALILLMRTKIPALRFVIATPPTIIHFLFPIYIHYSKK